MKPEKTIVNSLRLLHETFLYFEIGSNQVANNDNNFCNKIKPRWENPHEFNNFATQEHFFFLFFFFTYYALTPHTQTCITQPTDFLPSNTSNSYVRQLTTANTAYVFFSRTNFETSHTTQKRKWHVELLEKSPLKNNPKNYNLIMLENLKMIQNQTRRIILIWKTFIYFIFQTGMVWKMRREM